MGAPRSDHALYGPQETFGSTAREGDQKNRLDSDVHFGITTSNKSMMSLT
jgi:hypothetical protein